MNKKLLIIFAIIAVSILIANPASAKESVKVKITTEDNPFSYSGNIIIKLTDSNGRDIKKGGTIHYTVTDSSGHYEWKYHNYKGKVSIEKPNGKYKVEVKFDGDSKHKGAKLTKTVTIASDGSSNPYIYYENHNYGDSIIYDDYIYDNYWDEEIYDDASNYDGEGY